jgi:DedD protein
MADTDAQLELKKRARRRLIGAIALVLAAAVFLPMVMDSEPHSGGNDLQIRIPSQEGSNYTSRLITTAPSASAPVQAVPLLPPPTDPEMAPSSAAVAVSSAASSASASVSSSKAVHSAAHSSSTSKAESSVSAEARAKSLLENGAAPPADSQHFFVQLGAYRDPENVKSVLAQLKRVGMTASTDKVGDKTRVRVGPFKTRQAADAAAARLKHGGLNGVVTAK